MNSEEQSSYANKTIIHDITSPSAPKDYEDTKHKAAQREFVKNLADKGTERINTELVPQLNIKFNDYDQSIADNNEKLGKVDELSGKLTDLESVIEDLEASLDMGGSNEWTFKLDTHRL